MSSELAATLIGTLAVGLAVVSAVAGALWYRLRSLPALRALLPARDLAERLERLDGLIERLEQVERAARSARSGAASGPGNPTDGAPESSSTPRLGPALRIDARVSAVKTPAPPPVSPTGPCDDPQPPPGPTLITVPDLSDPGPGPTAIEVELAERYGSIWSQAERGSTPETIARETGLPIGQVELILGLRRRLAAGDGK